MKGMGSEAIINDDMRKIITEKVETVKKFCLKEKWELNFLSHIEFI